jgi:alpha-glucosidase
MLGLPGQVFLYQGEELGLEEVVLPDDRRQDPVFFHTGGRQPGRDGCRVPLPWRRGEPNAGFSGAAPWLPMPPGWDSLAIDAQDASSDSTLGLYRRALALRRTINRRLPVLMSWCPAPDGVLVYTRGALTVACNFLSRPVDLEVGGRLLLTTEPLTHLRAGRLSLPPNSSAWVDALSR